MSLLHNYTRPLRLPPNHPVSSFRSLLSACLAPVLCFETLLRYAVVPVRSGDAGAAGDRTGVALEAGQARLAVAVAVTVALAPVALASATSISTVHSIGEGDRRRRRRPRVNPRLETGARMGPTRSIVDRA